MKKKYLLILLIILPGLLFAQRRKVRMDSLEIRTHLEIGTSNNDVSSFLVDAIVNDKVISIGIGDTSITTEAIELLAITNALLEDSTITLAKLTTAANQSISSGGTITNNADDKTIKVTGTNLYVVNPFGEVDTLTVNSATPSVAGGPSFRTANTSSTTVTSFTDNPSASVFKRIFIEVNDSNTQYAHSTTFDCGGVTLAPDSLDTMEAEWTGHMWYVSFRRIKN